jgi:hypothetical protein
MSLGVDDPAVFEQGAEAINAAAGFAGDFNFSGRVDGDDFLAWQKSLGVNGPGIAADANLDGTVNAADLADWKSEFGRATSGFPVVAVPEPKTLELTALAAIGLAMGTMSLRRHSRRPLRTGFDG